MLSIARKLMVVVGLWLLEGLGPAFAEVLILFPAEQFGMRDLVPWQANTTSGRLVESLGGKEDRFEPMSRFRSDDPMRQAGRAVGSLRMLVQSPNGSEGIAVCTATLIATNQLLTNAHCIPGEEGKVLKAEVWLGYLRLGDESSYPFPVDITPIGFDRKLDYAILYVHGEPGKKFPVAKLTTRTALDNESLYLIHHPGGQPQKLTRAFCRAHPDKPIEGTVVRHQCDTLGGSSGSLIFAQSDHAFVGLHHSGGLSLNDLTSFNRGTDATALSYRIALLATAGAKPAAATTAPPVLKGLSPKIGTAVPLPSQPSQAPSSPKTPRKAYRDKGEGVKRSGPKPPQANPSTKYNAASQNSAETGCPFPMVRNKYGCATMRR